MSLFWALKSLRLCDLRAQNRQGGAHVQKITNGGCSLYVPVQSDFEETIHNFGDLKEAQLRPRQIARVMDTAASKSLRTGTYKLHPPLIVISNRKREAEIQNDCKFVLKRMEQ